MVVNRLLFRAHRETVLQQEQKQQQEEERERKYQEELERRKLQSHNMLAEELKREKEAGNIYV